MKKNNKLVLLICTAAGAIFCLTSCYTTGPDTGMVSESRQKENLYYIPASPNIPLLTKKNDLSLNAAASSGSKFNGTEIQAAWLPWKHIGICGSFSAVKTGSLTYGYNATKYNRVEVGSGYVTQLSKGWHFETYAGIGNGKILNTHYTGTSKTNITHFFLQPTIAISSKKQTIQFAMSSRFAGVNFKVQDTLFATGSEPLSASNLISLYDKPFHILWEPAVTFRFGWKNFLFNAQYTISSDLTNPDLNRANHNFSLGATFRFNTGEKTATQKPE
ncbi:MAG: hypothetical protein JJE22_19090 [Bacteroidia bacterium]|nr:hypothetical protein [Bacteroidia bacterium]